jgi:hypothetical protein
MIIKLIQKIQERSKISFNRFLLRQGFGGHVRSSAGKLVLLACLSIAPISAGIYCIDNEEHSIECPCNCDVIQGRHCIDCMHLQDAQPINVVHPSQQQIRTKEKLYTSDNPQDVLKKLAAQYVKNKYDV